MMVVNDSLDASYKAIDKLAVDLADTKARLDKLINDEKRRTGKSMCQ